MTTDTNLPQQEQQKKKVIYRNAGSAPVYGIGLIGALVYYLQHATTFMAVILGILKSIVWPALVLYKLLEYLKM